MIFVTCSPKHTNYYSNGKERKTIIDFIKTKLKLNHPSLQKNRAMFYHEHVKLLNRQEHWLLFTNVATSMSFCQSEYMMKQRVTEFNSMVFIEYQLYL